MRIVIMTDRIAAFLLFTVLGGCTRVDSPAPMDLKLVPVESPAGPGSRWPDVKSGADGKLYLTWTESGPDGHALRLASWDGDRWSEGRTVAGGKHWFVNWADFSTVTALEDGSLATHWLPKSSAGTYSYDVAVALSRDAGRTWSDPITPHRDGTPTEHGFVSLVPLPEGLFGIFWLDGREMTAGHEGGDGNMALRYTTLSPEGVLGKEVLVDDRVCECCQTSALRSSDGSLLVAYRDRSADEVRDIRVGRIDPEGRVTTRTVHDDNWKIAGCPVNGPAIASRGDTVAVCWFGVSTGEEGHVRVSFSRDGGKSFETPIEVDDGDPIGRVDLLFVADDSVLVCWQESVGDGAEIRLRRVSRDGTPGVSLTVTPTVRARSAGFARLGRIGDRILIAWTGPSDPPRIRTSRLTLGGE